MAASLQLEAAQARAPERQLFRSGRVADALHDRGPGGDAPRLTLAQDQRAGDALEQPGDRLVGCAARFALARRRVIDIEQQNAETGEDGLSLPQAQQLIEVLGDVGQAIDGQQGGAQAQRRGRGGGDRQGVGGGTAQLHDRQLAATAGARPALRDLLGEQPVRRRQRVHRGNRQRIEPARQPRVELADADQEVQHPLVDFQRGTGEDRVGRDFDQPPAAQRRFRRQRRPMRIRQDAEREAEGRERARRLALRRGAKRRELGVQLHADAQQQQLRFEGREVECLDHSVERDQFRRGRRRLGCGFPAQSRFHDIQPPAQFSLVLLVALDGWVCHLPLPGSDGDS